MLNFHSLLFQIRSEEANWNVHETSEESQIYIPKL